MQKRASGPFFRLGIVWTSHGSNAASHPWHCSHPRSQPALGDHRDCRLLCSGCQRSGHRCLRHGGCRSPSGAAFTRRACPRSRPAARPVPDSAAGLAVAIYPLAFYSAMRLSGVAVGTVVSIASAPLFTVILEWACTRRSVSLRWGLSFAFGAAGIALLATGRPEPGSADTGIAWTWLGVLVGLLAGLTYATYSWAARHMIEQGVGSASSMASMFGVAAIVLLPSLLLTGQNLFATPINAGVALYMALIPMFVGYLCFGYGLRYIAASTATLITLLEPVVAVLLAVLVVGEWLAPAGWVGMTLIMLSLLMQTLRSSPDASG